MSPPPPERLVAAGAALVALAFSHAAAWILVGHLFEEARLLGLAYLALFLVCLAPISLTSLLLSWHLLEYVEACMGRRRRLPPAGDEAVMKGERAAAEGRTSGATPSSNAAATTPEPREPCAS